MFDMYEIYRGPSVDRDAEEYRKKFIQLTHDTQVQAKQCELVRSDAVQERMMCRQTSVKDDCTGFRYFTKACRMA